MSKFSFKKRTHRDSFANLSTKRGNSDMHTSNAGSFLNPNIGRKDIEMDMIRKGFGRGLRAAGEVNEAVVALCADLTGSICMDDFAKAYPDRFV